MATGACPFCRLTFAAGTRNEHVLSCLGAESIKVSGRTPDSLAKHNQVRVVTTGDVMLDAEEGLPFCIALDLDRLKKVNDSPMSRQDVLYQEILVRLQPAMERDLQPDQQHFTIKGGDGVVLTAPRLLKPGECITVHFANPDRAEPEGDRKSTSQSHAHPNVLVSSEDYFLSSNNPVAYVVSEFVDNSLMAIILNTRQLKGRIDVYILIRGETVALIVSDNGSGIQLDYLEHVTSLADRQENIDELAARDHHKIMFTDSVISRFGRGLKHAAFFLGMLLKIVTTVPDNPKVFETTMDIKEMRRKYKTNRASSWEFEKQSRDPGDPLRKGQTSDAERASDWAKKRLAD